MVIYLKRTSSAPSPYLSETRSMTICMRLRVGHRFRAVEKGSHPRAPLLNIEASLTLSARVKCSHSFGKDHAYYNSAPQMHQKCSVQTKSFLGNLVCFKTCYHDLRNSLNCLFVHVLNYRLKFFVRRHHDVPFSGPAVKQFRVTLLRFIAQALRCRRDGKHCRGRAR